MNGILTNEVHTDNSAVAEVEPNSVESNNNNLIQTMTATDFMNDEKQKSFKRVHVLCCGHCDFLTISLDSLEQHLKHHHSIPHESFNELKIFSCQKCKCVSTEIKLIEEHIKIFHRLSMDKATASDKLKSTKNHNNNVLKSKMKPFQSSLLKKRLKMKLKRHFSTVAKSFGTKPIKVEKDSHFEENDSHMSVEKSSQFSEFISENDPLDMSVNSTTCPFRGVKSEKDYMSYDIKPDIVSMDNMDSLNNNFVNNSLLSNPQACLEIIKLTLNHMAKSNEQNKFNHPGFNPCSIIQPQFHIPSNLIPLLLPTTASVTVPNHVTSQTIESPFTMQNSDIDAILSNIQQQNLLKSLSPNSFDHNNQLISTHSPLFLNQKISGVSSNIGGNIFIDSNSKNGNINLSSGFYNSRRQNDNQTKLSSRKPFKKNVSSKLRLSLSDDLHHIQKSKIEPTKTEPTSNDNLFNRTFLDSSDNDINGDQIAFERLGSSCDTLETRTSISNKSSPNMAPPEKPHRQNFTSQQNRILSEWFYSHCDKPYPSTEDTKELSGLSGLTYSQVKKWFANKRARSSLNKKGHKNFCMINSAESSIDDVSKSDIYSDSLMPISPSQKSFSNSLSNANQDCTTPVDFTVSNGGDDSKSPRK